MPFACIDEYFKRFPPKSPDLSKKKFDDELEDLSGRTECKHLTVAPFEAAIMGKTYTSRADKSVNKYLWVVRQDGIPSMLESGAVGKSTSRGYLSHTNLTGGSDAGCGGELWFITPKKFYFNGASSRYPIKSEAELTSMEHLFKDLAYDATSFGWDPDKGAAAKFYREIS